LAIVKGPLNPADLASVPHSRRLPVRGRYKTPIVDNADHTRFFMVPNSRAIGVMPDLAVIIPYYQRQPGILSRAIQSALEQKAAPSFAIIVVDDGSPVPARAEIGELMAAQPDRIRLIEQTNVGPGAARNTGLDAVPEGTRYVAFLDSDDEWTANHLARAIAVLRRGYDCYFSDLYHLGMDVSSFTRSGVPDLSRHRPLAGDEATYEFTDDMFRQVVDYNVVNASTVVYDFTCFPNIRFRTEYRHAGEDYIFWLELVRAGARFVFSVSPECRRGHGVNVYDSPGWGSVDYLKRACDEIRYRRHILAAFEPGPTHARILRTRIKQHRRLFALALLGQLRRGRWRALCNAVRYCRIDPVGSLLLPYWGLTWLAHPNRRMRLRDQAMRRPDSNV